MSELGPGDGRSRRPRGGGFAQSMAFSAARGGGLIALAIVVGLVLLQVVDSSGGEASGQGITVTTQAPETETPDDTASAEEPPAEAPEPAAEPRPPDEVRVKVLNGADPAEPLAGALSEELRVAGYQTVPPDNTAPRTGTVVFCKEDFAADAPPLATVVSDTAAVEPFPEPPPENAENVEEYDCLVVLGT